MKYLFALVLGMASGALAGLAFLFYNPFTTTASVTPLMVSDGRQFVLSYSAVPDEAILYTNNGESRVRPVPEKTGELWEPTLRETEILVTELHDYRGRAGVGIKFSSRSEETRLLSGKAIVDSAWHISLPARGTLFVAQRENRWDYLRDIVVPAYLSSADSWRGTWRGILSAGPNALGTARADGGSGEFAGIRLEAVEYLSARAWSTASGPVAVDGELILEFPSAEPVAVQQGGTVTAPGRQSP